MHVRRMTPADAEIFARYVRAQGWGGSERFEKRLQDRDRGLCHALTAEDSGEPVGYIYLYKKAADGPFLNLPEIVDLGVHESARRRGAASALMDAAEELARGYSDRVCLAVGLHSGYGAAQRLYVLRGYVPDGSGAWYKNRVWPQYEPFVNDDDLVIYLTKDLPGGAKCADLRRGE